MKKKQIKRNVEFLFELGTLRYAKRTWVNFLNPDFQNLAEHHFRVVWIALLIAKEEKIKDVEKIMKMALIHDVPESRTGDVNYLQRQYVIRNEDLALDDIVTDISIETEIKALWKEYSALNTIEAKIVKDADNLDVDFELQEQAFKGYSLPIEWKAGRKFVSEKKLYTETAKQLWEEITTANPHNWHINGRNRYTSGDWKKRKSTK
jgi:putative hydrolase of HD superfamily